VTLQLSTKLVSMSWGSGSVFFAASLALAIVFDCSPMRGQNASDEVNLRAPVIDSLQLAPEVADQLKRAVHEHDNVTAEKLLLSEIDRDPHSVRGAHLLAYAGSIYFRNGDYVNAAIAWKKSEAIVPLDPPLRFSLAMAYVHMAHPDWARTVLKTLAAQDQKSALYPYWLGRLDYDGHLYEEAIRHFQDAINLNPQMARAYDNLGLCFFYQNQNELALANYERAIQIERRSQNPSPWPYLDIAITQQFLNRLPDAEKNLREAIRLDPSFAKAHFQLGTVLEDLKRPEEALSELRGAARLDPTYPEPHMAMARILHKVGQEAQAREEVQTYLRLHTPSTP
jgi:tetratricopeptide (TPR) repeat protein